MAQQIILKENHKQLDTKLLLSVVLVNHNGYRDLRITLPALFNTLPDNAEVILVDNNSSDESLSFVREHFPDIKIIRSGENLGFGQGNNLGAEQATGEFLLFLNPDTKPEPGFAEALIDALRKDATIGMTTSKVLIMHEPAFINTCGNNVHLTGLTLCRGYRAERNAPAYSEAVDVPAVSGACFAMRRSVFEAVGGFGELFFLYMEDTDLSLRVRLAGYRCVYVPLSVVYHDYSLRFGTKKVYFQEHNRYVMLLKIYQWRTLLLMLPALFLSEVISWGFVLLRERKNHLNKIHAYRDVLREWSEIMAERRKTTELRKSSDKSMLAMTGYSLEFEQTGDGLVARTAHFLFDPLFYLWHRLMLLLVRW